MLDLTPISYFFPQVTYVVGGAVGINCGWLFLPALIAVRTPLLQVHFQFVGAALFIHLFYNL